MPQAESLKWLGRTQARVNGFPEDESTFHRRVAKFGCPPGVIDRRATFLPDFTHDDWARMQIYRDRQSSTLDHRQAFYREAVRAPVEALVPEADFNAWVHVSCTGYVSPSVVQDVTSRRGWGSRVETLHAYHMGCYAAFPALRMARGLTATEITHTELCTLHLDVANTEPEQLVINSLFADGAITYRATDADEGRTGYRVEAAREVIASESRDAMTWGLSAAGFRMTLSREVPKLVRQHVTGVVAPWREPGAVYAIHPGGPRIIDAVKEALNLNEEQVTTSREVLREYGNMSSATLPHVWMRLRDQIAPGTPVISLAFGPGLTIAASLMRAT